MLIYVDGKQIEVEDVVIYNPFPEPVKEENEEDV